MIATSIRNNSMTIVVNNKVFTINSEHPNYAKVLEAVKSNDEKGIIDLLSVKKAIARFTEGNVTVVGGEVWYRNNRLEGILVERILEFIRNDLPVVPLMKFINKLMDNPSQRAVKELYTFLEHRKMPITPEGNFLAYKGLLNNFYSVYGNKKTVVLKGQVDSGGHIFNGVGEEILIERNSVCDDKEIGCAEGVHAGSLEYARGYSQGKMVIVEINPANVVSVPLDCSCQKLRSCGYTVVGEYVEELNNNYCDDYDQSEDEIIDDEDDVVCPCFNKANVQVSEGGQRDRVEAEFFGQPSDEDADGCSYNAGYQDGSYDGSEDQRLGYSYGENKLYDLSDMDDADDKNEIRGYLDGYYKGYYQVNEGGNNVPF